LDYYRAKARAIQDIAGLLNKKTSVKKIYYIIGVNYGFGTRAIDEMIGIIKEGS
jgi:hypothetical protein